MEHETNNEVLHLAKATPTLLSSIKKRKCKYFGHFTRENSIQRVILEGKIEGKRGKGRPRVQWIDNIKDWTNLNYCDCVRLANNKEEWKPMTFHLLGADDNEAEEVSDSLHFRVPALFSDLVPSDFQIDHFRCPSVLFPLPRHHFRVP